MREQALFGLVHGFVDLVEAFDGEKEVVDVVNFHGSVENFIEIEIAHQTVSDALFLCHRA